MPQHLPLVETAARVHTAGLNFALAGEFDTAHAFFYDALSRLEYPPVLQTPAVLVQKGRVGRDAGFTDTRQANYEEDSVLSEGHFADAEQQLTASAVMLQRVTNASRRAPRGKAMPSLTPDQHREALSEHAMTCGLLGVTVIARAVSLNRIDHGEASPREDIMRGLVRIIKAYELATQGTNMYYVARLARLALRAEEIIGRPHTTLWVGRIMTAAAQASVSDSSNARQAFGQLEKVRRQAMSYERALAATRNWRTV